MALCGYQGFFTSSMASTKDLFPAREIFTAVNNALSKAARCAPASIEQKRLNRLQKYAQALVASLKGSVERGDARQQEAVFILLSAALAMQGGLCGHRSELLAEAKEFWDKPPEKEKPWIGIDLDGTLAEYHGWKGVEHIGDPTPLVKTVRELLKKGQRVKIFTARVSGADSEQAAEHIAKWCQEHLGQVLEITCEKDFAMTELWDDRCKQVAKNTGCFVA